MKGKITFEHAFWLVESFSKKLQENKILLFKFQLKGS